MPEAMALLRGWVAAEGEVAGTAGAAAEAKAGQAAAAAGEAAEAAPAPGQEASGLQLKGQVPEKKKSSFKLSVPGSFALLLGFILLLVFAVSPAYSGAPYTRLQLLVNIVLKGGGLKPEATSGVQPLAAMPSNGSAGADYHIQGLLGSGSIYSGEVGMYG